jgi:hypothetical protein
MSSIQATEDNGTGWFNPEPTSLANFVLNPIDSLMVWVGRPQDGNYYDINKRWLSEIIDFDTAMQPVKVFSDTGKSSGNVIVNLPAWGAGTKVRVAFQVKTGRQFSDETYELHGFDSVEGAALIDNVRQNTTLLGDFEAPGDITVRALLPGSGLTIEQDPLVHWVATGKPPAGYGHIHNVFDLPYDDPCGGLGDPGRTCNLIDNAITLSNHDDPDHAFFRESWTCAMSPTIDLSPGSPLSLAGVGDATHDVCSFEFDLFSGRPMHPLESAVFFQVGASYFGPGFQQQADDPVPAWSDAAIPPAIYVWHGCETLGGSRLIEPVIPPPSQLDSMRVFVWNMTRCARFGATVLCGKPDGVYFDNVRIAFAPGEGAAITALGWDLLADTFPFSEDVSPGSADFDTTTALIKCGLNNAANDGSEGVIIGDTLTVKSSFVGTSGSDTRLDFIFRIKPGPGNYSEKGDANSPLWKVPSEPALGIVAPGDGSYWGQYLLSQGPFGKGVHNGNIWNPNTWNSARMDSADNGNISPLAGRELGTPVDDAWTATLHEDDPNYASLGLARNICFLVSPNGQLNHNNICCSADACAAAPFFDTWPPGAYPMGSPTTTIEGTKIIPDGLLTPGSHIEYFMRRSDAPAGMANWRVTPDTTRADLQPALGPHWDGQRFLEIGVLPDLWKDLRFGGNGLACMLVIDAMDRWGQEHTVLGALDSLGYGENKGAGRGWWEDDPSTSNPNPNDPDNWVFKNLGQKGLSFDWYDIQAAESAEGDRPGCRLATAPPQLQDRQCKQGPTPEMLKKYYNTILWMGGRIGILHDGESAQQQSDDIGLIQDFLASSASGSERAVWLAGDEVANWLQNLSLGSGPTLLNTYFAAIVDADDYRTYSGNRRVDIGVSNLISEYQPPSTMGYSSTCSFFPDVLSVNGAVADGVLAQRYEDSSDGDVSINPGVFGSAVYRPADNLSRFYTTLITGYGLEHLRGNGFASSTTGFGRISFVDRVLSAFTLCASIGPVIAVGDLPGVSAAQLNFVRGSYPNPSATGETTVHFSLARPTEVTIRFYNVAGRLVHEAIVDGVAGPNRFRWDGSTSTGIRATPGVYFYRLSAPGLQFQNNSQRMVLLGAGAR